MEEYWELFVRTGAPVFYLLYRHSPEQEARVAWRDGETKAKV